MTCDKCNASIPDGSKFCPKCGKKFLHEKKICPFNNSPCNADCSLRFLSVENNNKKWKCSITGIAEGIDAFADRIKHGGINVNTWKTN